MNGRKAWRWDNGLPMWGRKRAPPCRRAARSWPTFLGLSFWPCFVCKHIQRASDCHVPTDLQVTPAASSKKNPWRERGREGWR